MDNLLNSEYEIICEIVRILRKYRESIEILESGTCTISKTVPCLENLKCFLLKNQKEFNEMTRECIDNLLQDYKSRFQNVFEISSPNFQVCFLISTCLDV